MFYLEHLEDWCMVFEKYIPTMRLSAAIALTALTLAGSVSLAADDPSAPKAKWESTIEQAEKAYMDGDIPQSNQLCASALAQATDDQSRSAVLNQTGVIEMNEKRFRDAEKSFSLSLDIRKTIDPKGALTLQTLSNYALATYKLGDDAKAEALYKQCIDDKRALLPGSESLAKTLTNLAHLYSDEKKCDDAKKLYEEALTLDTKNYGANHQEVATDLFNIGALLERCTDYAAALDYLNRANATYQAISDKLGSVKALHYISLCQSGLKNYDEAAKTSMQSLALHEELIGKGHPDTLIHLLNAAKALDSAGQSEKAGELYKQALSCASSSTSASNFNLAECNLDMAQFYKNHGKKDEAEHYFKTALAHYDELTKKEQRLLYELPLAYSQLLRDMRRNAESDQLAHQYLQIYSPTP